MSALDLAHGTHQDAMEAAETAFLAAMRGDHGRAAELYRQAFDLERRAAETLVSDLDSEPTRSILFRSAATLGLRCGDLRDAERLAAIGLSGNAPDEIADELR